jgi:decaprenylphospho-beta-D-ribofuranose 2-oxidase
MTRAVPPRAVARSLFGWSRTPVARSEVYRPEHRPEVAAILRHLAGRRVVARGRGTAYGDAALNDRESLVDMLRLSRFLAFDPESGRVTCEAGVPLRALAELAVPQGWFLAVSPGTWKSTVGGCVACDVHGKNHHVAGSFSSHVISFRLMLADGRVVECSRTDQPELFWATAGGLGLTGVILDVSLQLQRIETSSLVVRYARNRDLDETFAALERSEPEPYSVAWLDVLARGRQTGRSVLMLGRHARREDLPPGARGEPLSFRPGPSLRLPCAFPDGAMSAPMVRAFNAVYYRRFPADGRPVVQGFRPFFYPLDAIDNFNLLYGRRGLYEYQFVVPAREARRVLQTIVERLAAHGFGSFLCVLKRLGAGNAGPMSFPADGYTLAVDVPARGPALLELMRGFDELVAASGGRVYLAKDARLAPDMVDAMYPRRRAWAALLDRVDPGRLFESSLSRRLALRAP